MSIPAGYKCNQWGLFYKESDNSGPYYLDANGSMAQGFPTKFYTDSNGPNARLRVDVGQTGFFAGRERRLTYPIAIATGATQIIKIVAAVNTILYGFEVDLLLAQLHVELLSGGTEGGSFSTTIPSFSTNMMTTAPEFTSQVTLTTGGTLTGGTIIEQVDVVSGSNPNKASAATAGDSNPVGFPPGTYYIRLVNTDGATTSGYLRLRWEERP